MAYRIDDNELLIPNNGALVDTTASVIVTSTVHPEGFVPLSYRPIYVTWRVQGGNVWQRNEFSDGVTAVNLNNIPANSNVEYYLEQWWPTDTGGTQRHYTQTANITTKDLVPSYPMNLNPQNIRVDGNETNIFSWVHNNPSGSEQSKAELQYSTNNGGNWASLATVTGSNQFAEIPAETLPSGLIMWRVRTYNADNVAGDYSEPAQIIVKTKPSAPVINTIDAKPICTITWGSVDQMGYRVVFEDSNGNVDDTGERYGSERTYTSKILLADGEATVTVYVGNASGEWNSTTATFTVQNVPSESFTVRTERDLYETTFTFDGVAYITRNGELIGKGNGTFTDRAGAGRCIYNVIKLNNGYYTKSEDITVLYSRIKTAVVYDVETNGEFIVLNVRKESPVVLDKGFSASVAYNNYCGAEYPTAYYSGYKNEGISLAITRTVDNNAEIRALLGKLCCLRDKQGESVYCVLNSISESVERWNDISLEFTRVNYENGVTYET